MRFYRAKQKFLDILPPYSKTGQGFVVDLRNKSIAKSRVNSEILERSRIMKELKLLEALEQKRKTELEKLLQPPPFDFSFEEKEDENKENKKTIEKKGIIIFALSSFIFSLIIPSFLFYQRAQAYKQDLFQITGEAISHVKNAGENIANSNFQESIQEFKNAESKFAEGNKMLDTLGAGVFKFFDGFPLISLIPTAERILQVGQYLTQSAQELALAADYFVTADFNIYSQENKEAQKNLTLIDAIVASKDHASAAQKNLASAKAELNSINTKSLRSDLKEQLQKFEQALDQIQTKLNKSDQYFDALLKILGNDHPKLYLFIFQNNQELRATGGFIGTYGLFKIDNGHIEKMMVDGIYNPDGQLKEKIVPPFPLWKISPNWGLRDANWFPDFPTSAKKIVWFYEKTGGPTVDGVVSFTPTVMERLLRIIGPIEMPEYGVTVTAENFVEVTQREVELDYDKELNQPKQFLTDLTPIVLEKIFNAPKEKIPEIFKVFSQNIKERHIMFYFLNEELERLILEEDLGGALKDAPQDYLSVVNSNIDGRKTDGIIDSEVYHHAKIQADGSIIDTVTLKRTHKGGKEEYDWWNAKNKSFVRVYVPKGSEFIEAKGFSKEVSAPLLEIDYSDYKKDELVNSIEQNQTQDEKSGAWIFEENNKTVFANWVYTGPEEISEVSFTYKLPFKARSVNINSYSLLIQKQAGTISDKLFTSLELRDNEIVEWQYPDLRVEGNILKKEFTLDVDKFYGVVLR